MRILAGTFLIFLLFIPSFLQGEIILTPSMKEADLSGKFDILEDPAGGLSLEQISTPGFSGVQKGNVRAELEKLRKAKQPGFVRADSTVMDLGFSSSAFWLRFELRNHTPEHVGWLMEIGYPALDYITVYFPLKSGEYKSIVAGDRYPFYHKNRLISYRNAVFKVPTDLETSRPVYIRVQTSGRVKVPLTLYRMESFTDKVIAEQFGYGIYFGLMGIMVFFNLFIFLSTRDSSYFYYVIFISSSIIFQMILTGYAFQYLWPNYIDWAHYSTGVFFNASGVGLLLLTRKFLTTERTVPRLDRVLIGAAVIGGLLGLSSFFFSHRINAYLMLGGGAVFILLAVTTGYYTLIQGYRAARFFVLSFTTFFLMGLVYILGTIGVLPSNFFTDNGFLIGTGIEVLLLSLGLADRINIMKREREFFQAELLDSRKVMLSSFSRFVPREFLQHLGRDSIVDVEMGDAVQRKFTVLFTDIREFTSLSEKMSAVENFQFLNSYLKRMEPLIRHSGGFIDKFIGDAILALFPEDVDDALNAAVEMRRELESYNEGRISRGFEAISMGIGMHNGELMLGTIGSDNRLDTTVIGDTVNLASRLETMTKVFRIPIIISDAVFRNLKNPEHFYIREIDFIRLKGKQEPVVIYEVFSADPIALREAKLKSLESYNEGLRFYKEGAFEQSRVYFETLAMDCPDDLIASMYLRRCVKLIENPPGENWRGVSRVASRQG